MLTNRAAGRMHRYTSNSTRQPTPRAVTPPSPAERPREAVKLATDNPLARAKPELVLRSRHRFDADQGRRRATGRRWDTVRSKEATN